MPFRPPPLLLLSAMVLAGCVVTGSPSRVFVKEDVTWYSYRAELDNCFQQVRGRIPVDEKNKDIGKHTDPTAVAPTNVGVGGALAIGIIGGIASGIARARAESNWVAACMDNKGFVEIALEEDEQSHLGALTQDNARTDFLQGVLDSEGRALLEARAARERAAAETLANQKDSADGDFWAAVERSGRAEDYQRYLAVHPNGAFVETARARLAAPELLQPGARSVVTDSVGAQDQPISPAEARQIVQAIQERKSETQAQLVDVLVRDAGATLFRNSPDCHLDIQFVEVVRKRSDGVIVDIDYTEPVVNHGIFCHRGEASTSFVFDWDGTRATPLRLASVDADAPESSGAQVSTANAAGFIAAVVERKAEIEPLLVHILEGENNASMFDASRPNCDLDLERVDVVGQRPDGIVANVTYSKPITNHPADCNRGLATSPFLFDWNGERAEPTRLLSAVSTN